jgi:hypothetical protein
VISWIGLIWLRIRSSGAMDWVNQAQDRVQWWLVVNMVMNLRIPLNSRKFVKMSNCQLHNKEPDA